MGDYFCGWYFKCTGGQKTIALIPAYHRGAQRSSSIQVITDHEVYNAVFPYEAFGKKTGFSLCVGENAFSEKGLRVDLRSCGVPVWGELSFGAFTPIAYDIMGPFALVPFMECRHSVVSMRHDVSGNLTVGNETFSFAGGTGYIEGDRGRSFPKVYLWTQCFFAEGSLMLSVADIPIGPARFTGVIGVLFFQGKEYRVATYLGAKAESIADGEVTIRQKDLTLRAKLLEKNAHPLFAPQNGVMVRTIRESASCRAEYECTVGEKTLFRFTSEEASFEYEYPQ